MAGAIPLTAVLFDMDGVLVDSTEAHERAWAHYFASEGVRPPAAGVRSLFGRRAADAVGTLLGVDPASDEGRAALATLEAHAARVFDGYGPGALLVPDVGLLLDRLAADGWLLAVATSARRPVAEHGLGDLRDRFAAVVTAEDVTHGKPHPEVYLTAAARLGVRPDACVVVEDATAGVEAGRRAGMRVVGVAGTADPDALRRAGAHAVVDTVMRVEALLDTWRRTPELDEPGG